LGSCCEEMAVSDGSAGACPCVRRTAVVMAADLLAAAFEKKNAGPGLIQARRITLSGDVACRDGSELEAGVQVVLAAVVVERAGQLAGLAIDQHRIVEIHRIQAEAQPVG